MNIILLSGGSGQRLWPLSNSIRSKQFLKILTAEDGGKESMLQRMYRMITAVDPGARITVATSQSQIPQIRAQLGERVDISIEPCRRDTFPAIALAAAFLKHRGAPDDEPVVVCPVDPYVEQPYFECLKQLSALAGSRNLTLMGIEPTYPSEKYGYIIPSAADAVAPVQEFKEKPDAQTAAEYIAQGALWNGGVFAFKLEYLLGIAEQMLGTSDYETLFAQYASLPKISFDYAVVEQEPSIQVVRFHGEWKDLGTWNTLTEVMDDQVRGDASAVDCPGTYVINELGIPLIALGIPDSVIAATPDGILVSTKESSPKIKSLARVQRPMYERREWGEYKVLDMKVHDDGNNSIVKEVVISAGMHISYHFHQLRTEVWTVTEGSGEIITEDGVRPIQRGDVLTVPAGMKHGIRALTDLHIIEVQFGEELTEDDVHRLDFDWSAD